MGMVRESWLKFAKDLNSQFTFHEQDKVNAAAKKYTTRYANLTVEITANQPAIFKQLAAATGYGASAEFILPTYIHQFMDITTKFVIDLSSIKYANDEIEGAFSRAFSSIWSAGANLPGVLWDLAKKGADIAEKLGEKAFDLYGLTVNLVKWGAIAGGVYLLWTVLKPKKESSTEGAA
jgi:hypothetical protein